MRTVRSKRPLRYVAYWCFYLHQGMITALLLQGVSSYFRAQGWDLAQLSLLSLTLLPWVAKFIWAPWLERHAYAYRSIPYLGSLATLQCVMALLLAAIGTLSPATNTALLLSAFMLLTLFSASHDIYADGITILTTSTISRPWANTAQVGGSYAGMFLGTSLFLTLAEYMGWQGAFSALALLSLILLLVALYARRALPSSDLHRTPSAPSFALRHLCPLWPMLLFTALYYPAMRGFMALQSLMLVDRQLSLSTLGQILTLYGTVMSAIGILLGNVLARRLGAVRSLLPVMMLQTLLIGLLALCVNRLSLPSLIGLLALLNLAAAAGFVTLYNALRGWARSHQPASDYALFQSVDMAVAILMSLLAMRIAHHVDYAATLLLLALLSLFSLWPATRLLRRIQTSIAEPSLTTDSMHSAHQRLKR